MSSHNLHHVSTIYIWCLRRWRLCVYEKSLPQFPQFHRFPPSIQYSLSRYLWIMTFQTLLPLSIHTISFQKPLSYEHHSGTHHSACIFHPGVRFPECFSVNFLCYISQLLPRFSYLQMVSQIMKCCNGNSNAKENLCSHYQQLQISIPFFIFLTQNAYRSIQTPFLPPASNYLKWDIKLPQQPLLIDSSWMIYLSITYIFQTASISLFFFNIIINDLLKIFIITTDYYFAYIPIHFLTYLHYVYVLSEKFF